jgi:hypothetical protein
MSNFASPGNNSTVVQVYGDNNYVSVGAPRTLMLYQFAPVKTASPASMLAPYNRESRFIGRDAELKSIQTWLDGEAPISVRIVVGQGGIGKTRLAIEAAVQSTSWISGFLTGRELQNFIRSEHLGRWEWREPTFAIIDYAEQKADAVGSLIAELSDRSIDRGNLPPHKLRLLLIERYADQDVGWVSRVFGSADSFRNSKTSLLDPSTPVVLEPLDAKSAREILEDTVARRCMPGDSFKSSLVERLASRTSGATLLGNPLILQAAALSSPQYETVHTRNDLLNAVVERERAYMRHEWRQGSVKEFLFPNLEQLVAMIGIVGGATVDKIVAIVDGCASFELLKRTMGIADILMALKPTLRGDGLATVRPLEPDLIGDLFLAQTRSCRRDGEFCHRSRSLCCWRAVVAHFRGLQRRRGDN